MADEQVPPAIVSGPELVRAWFEHSPFTRQLGLRILELTADGAELVMPFDPAHTTQADIMAAATCAREPIPCAAGRASTSSTARSQTQPRR